MVRLTPLLLVVALVGPGCAYVGQKTFEQKRDSLDQDKDGAPFGGPNYDCDDTNKLIAPGNDEIPYDGLDNDCKDGDLVDADGDGYPGILRADYEALFPKAKWPASVVDSPLDCADDPNKYANAAAINPNAGSDPVYDGIDLDCNGNNDFDADGDGFVPDLYKEAFEAYVIEWGYENLTATTQFGDCNDSDAAVNPSIPAEDDVWYDGDDSDCAGNNDFDADEDGFMWDETAHAALYAAFINTYHPEGAPWDPTWGDCYDHVDNKALVVAADPAQVFPGNPVDAIYDGVDSDCNCDNDFDGDGDGVMADVSAADFPYYIADWGCPIAELYGDCDDNDPITFPGALELFGDAADSDCDLDNDGTPFQFSYDWDDPSPPKIVRTTESYLILASAQWISFTPNQWVSAAIPFRAADSGYLSIPTTLPTVWTGVGVPLPLGARIDAEAYGSNAIGAATYQFQDASAYLNLRTMVYNPGTGGMNPGVAQYTVSSTTYTTTSMDLVVDTNGEGWAVACGATEAHVIRGTNAAGSIIGGYVGPNPLSQVGIPSGVCFWEDDPDLSTIPTNQGTARVVVCEPGVDCETYDFVAFTQPTQPTLAVSATNNWAGRQLDYGSFEDGWHTLLLSGAPGARLEGPGGVIDVLDQWDVSEVSAYPRDTNNDGVHDELYVAAVATPIPDDGNGPRVVLSYGDIGGSMSEKLIAFNHPSPTMIPAGVAVLADDDRLVIAVSAIDDDYDPYTSPLCGVSPPMPPPGNVPFCMTDTVGWAFFGWP